jgi:hypothetical protein
MQWPDHSSEVQVLALDRVDAMTDQLVHPNEGHVLWLEDNKHHQKGIARPQTSLGLGVAAFNKLFGYYRLLRSQPRLRMVLD